MLSGPDFLCLARVAIFGAEKQNASWAAQSTCAVVALGASGDLGSFRNLWELSGTKECAFGGVFSFLRERHKKSTGLFLVGHPLMLEMMALPALRHIMS
jgi:hypothetical protein